MLLEKNNEKLLEKVGDKSTISLSQIRYDIEGIMTEYGGQVITY